MGLLDENGHLEERQKVGNLIENCPTTKNLRAKVFSFFDALRESDNLRLSLDEFRGLDEMAALRETEVRSRLAPYLRRAADVDEDSDQLIAHIYRKLEPPYRGAEQTRALFNRLSESDEITEKQRQCLTDICRIENLLVRFEVLFQQLWLNGIDRDRSEPLIEYICARREILTTVASRPPLSKIASKRLRTLANVAEQPDSEDFVRSLAQDYHRETIAESRGNSPWVTFDGDRVVLLNHTYSPSSSHFDDISWNRDYYLRSLAAFKRDLEEVA
jgi:uncharacterized membrane protein YccC